MNTGRQCISCLIQISSRKQRLLWHQSFDDADPWVGLLNKGLKDHDRWYAPRRTDPWRIPLCWWDQTLCGILKQGQRSSFLMNRSMWKASKKALQLKWHYSTPMISTLTYWPLLTILHLWKVGLAIRIQDCFDVLSTIMHVNLVS